jgi:RNA polymerase sigma-70 factor (sigma-E family)
LTGKATFRGAQQVEVGVTRLPVPDCAAFVAALQPALVRSAYLLCGSQQDAEDLVQETLVRIVQRWRRVAAAEDSAAYASRILLNVFLSGRARRWHGELPHAHLPETAGAGGYDRVEDRDRLRRALLALPPRQRAAVVLRHYEQRSEADTAVLMACSVGTVKSLTSRGLAALRRVVDRDPVGREEGL